MAVTGIYSCPAKPFPGVFILSQLQKWRSKGRAHHLALSVRRLRASVAHVACPQLSRAPTP